MRETTSTPLFTEEEAEKLTEQLGSILYQVFNRQGDFGEAPGVYSVVGRGGDSLNDSYRRAEPSDKPRDYAHTLNARQLPGGPYVHTRANLYEPQGVIFPDIVGQAQPGDWTADYEREDLITATTELLLSRAFQLGYQPGVVLPDSGSEPQVFMPETSEGMMLEQLQECRRRKSQADFPVSLEALRELSPALEFVFILSDFLSEDPDWWFYLKRWRNSLIDLGHHLELIVIQIVDPLDSKLPTEGIVGIQQGKKVKEINTEDPRTQAAIAELAQKQQQDIAAVMRAAHAQHFQLMTDRQPSLIAVSGQRPPSY